MTRTETDMEMDSDKVKRSRLRYRLFFRILIPVYLLLSILGAAILFAYATNNKENLILQEEHAIEKAMTTLSGRFEAVISDLRFLKHSLALRRYIEHGDAWGLRDLRSELTAFSADRPSYSQYLFIDEIGNEVVSVSGKADHYDVLTEPGGNQAGQRLFEEAIALESDGVYVSHWEMSGNNLTPPNTRVPNIRFATPIFDDLGSKRGVFVLDYRGDDILERLDDAFLEAIGDVALVINDGDHLVSIDLATSEWTDKRFNAALFEHVSEILPSIMDTASRQVQIADGHVLYQAIFPLEKAYEYMDKTGSINEHAEHRSYRWIITSYLPDSLFFALESKTKLFLSLLFITALILSGITSWLLAKAQTARAIAEQNMLRARDEAESANKSKSMFLASMSHEIRTPMNGVIGMLELLSHSDLEADQRQMIDTINTSANSLLGIINDILDFSKIESGKLDLSLQPVNIEDTLTSVCKLFDQIAFKKQVQLTLFSDPGIPDLVEGDALRLQQILTNLLNNAIKFSAKTGRIGQVHISAELKKMDADEAWVTIAVRDNGIGIDENAQAKLFQPFIQAEAGTTRQYGGTGLGLIITRNLADMMGGNITLQSQPGEGSTFTVNIPFRVLSSKPVDAPVSLHNLDCIIVDREGGLGREYGIYLEHAGATVFHAKGVDEACQLLGSSGAISHEACLLVVDDSAEHFSLDKIDNLICHAEEEVQNKIIPLVFVSFTSSGCGRRRKPRNLSDRIVQIDREVLGRKSLLMAVAVAIGRTTTEWGDEGEQKPMTTHADSMSRDAAIEKRRLILVAEDNETNQLVISQQLDLLGYAADMTANGAEALERWKSDKYGLILTDLHMPEMDGYDLTMQIRKEEKESGKARIPIVALTANVLQDEEKRCLSLGMDAYISKPVDLNKLSETLEAHLPSVGP